MEKTINTCMYLFVDVGHLAIMIVSMHTILRMGKARIIVAAQW